MKRSVATIWGWITGLLVLAVFAVLLTTHQHQHEPHALAPGQAADDRAPDLASNSPEPDSPAEIGAPKAKADASVNSDASVSQAQPRPQPAWQRLLDAEVVESRDEPVRPDGTYQRTRVYRTDMKYPYVRSEETVRRLPSGEEQVVDLVAAVADHMLVRVHDGMPLNKVEQIASEYGLEIRRKMLAPDTYVLAFNDRSIDALPAALAALGADEAAVDYAEPDYIVHTMATFPNDPRLGQLWGLHQANNHDIDAPEAWDVSQGSRDVVVAVIDTGIDYNHPDLAANIWTNPGEVPGDGIDNDGNGFVDDVHGWDFLGNRSSPFDTDSHGTHCAGTIGAIGNNAVGVVGVNWQVRMMALRFIGPFGGYTSDAIDAVYYATQNGARLTSNSWGGGGYSQSMKNAIDNAAANDVLFIAAAGNDGRDNDVNPQYPASYASANLLSIAATDSNDRLAYFSNYGDNSVHLGAPGVGILSTIPTAMGSYASYSGTSMATPHVAGVAALLMAHQPALSGADVRQRLLDNLDAIASLSGKTTTGGRLNAYRALTSTAPPQPPAAPSGLTAEASADQIDLAWMDASDNEQEFVLERRQDGGSYAVLTRPAADSTSYVDAAVESGLTYTYRIKAVNEAGESDYSESATATVPGAEDAWDPGDDVGTGATALPAPTIERVAHGPHTLSGTDRADWFRIPLTAGIPVRLDSVGGDGDTYGELFRDAAGTDRVAYNDDGGGARMFLIEYTPDASADYYLKVRAYRPGQDAAYDLHTMALAEPNQPPSVSLTAPTAGRLYSEGDTVSLEATATDPDGSVAQVEFLANGSSLGSRPLPAALDWRPVSGGTYDLSAIATDDAGASTTSATVRIRVNQAPSVTLTAPADGTRVPAGESVTLTAQASDADGQIADVAFYSDDGLLARVSSAPYTLTWRDPAPGAYALYAVATDNDGDATTSDSVQIEVERPGVAPVLTPTSIIARARVGENALSQTLTVDNDQSGRMAYRVTTETAWITVTPTTAEVVDGPQRHTLSFDTDTFSAGTYTGSLLVEGTDPATWDRQVPVQLTVFSNSAARGLVAYYPLDNASGMDASGYGLDLIGQGVTNVPDAAGNISGATRFDGSSSRFAGPTPAFASGAMTWAAWVRPALPAPDPAVHPEILVGTSASNGNGPVGRLWGLYRSGTNASLWLIDQAQPHQVAPIHTPAALASETWTHLAVVQDEAGQFVFYVDGLPVFRKTVETFTYGDRLWLGGVAPDALLPTGIPFHGALDEVRLYNRALSEAEVWGLAGGELASLSGVITYAGPSTGTVYVLAGEDVLTQAGPGSYLLDNLTAPNTVDVTAFLDVNGDGAWQPGEPKADYVGNPVSLAGDMAGIDLHLAISDAELARGLLSSYPLDGDGRDASEAGRDLEATDTAAAPDRFGTPAGALQFTTSASHLSGDAPAFNEGAMTWALWVQAAEFSDTAFNALLGVRPSAGSGATGRVLGLHVGTQGLTVGLTEVFASNLVALVHAETTRLLPGNWAHIAVTHDAAGAVTLYVDGYPVGAGNFVPGAPTGDRLVVSGGTTPASTLPGSQPFNGTQDELRLYQRALSADEIWTLAAAGQRTELSGQITYDGSASGPIVVRGAGRVVHLPAPGAYALAPVPVEGQSRLAAFLDVNGNGVQDPAEPFGAYPEDPVVWTGSRSGLDIVLEDPAPTGLEVSGVVTYSGGHTGQFHVLAELRTDATMADASTTLRQVLPEPGGFAFSNLTPGTEIHLSAFLDLDGDAQPADWEPRLDAPQNPIFLPPSATNLVLALTDVDSDGDGLTDAFERGIGRYQIVLGDYTWKEAKADAEARGGHLATITSAAEWAALEALFGADVLASTDLWIGGTDEAVEGEWRWITGETWGYTRWKPREPNNLGGNEHYAHVWNNAAGLWNDSPNGWDRNYLWETGYYTDPANPDSDGDGLADGAEYEAGSDPTRADSDGDGLNDAAEVAAGTDPRNPDSDGDGVSDGREVLDIPCLDPLNPDTDGDGLSDGEELAAGSDPCDAADEVASVQGTVLYVGTRTGTVVVTATPVRPLADQAIAAYPLDGTGWDVSGHGHDLDNRGAIPAADRTDQADRAVRLLGDGGSLVAGDLVVDTPFSLSFWFRTDATAGQGLLTLDQGEGSTEALRIDQPAGQPGLRVVLPASVDNASAVYSGDTRDGMWRHVVAVVQPTNLQLYVDGTLAASQSLAGALTNTLTRLTLGAGTGTGPFAGDLDDLWLLPGVLQAADVAAWTAARGGETQRPGPGAYTISPLITGRDYTLAAYLDADGNGRRDDDEPQGHYAANPLSLTGDVAGIDIVLSVPQTGWTLRATHQLDGYISGATNTVVCEAHFPSNRVLLGLGWTVELPQGWTLTGAEGEGDPIVQPQTGTILFTSTNFIGNPVRFTYDVAIPAAETGLREIGGAVDFIISGTGGDWQTRRADPDPLRVEALNGFHSADFRTPRWVIDLQEANRLLSYWRAGGYAVNPASRDGYTPGRGVRRGARHSADYADPAWVITGEEALRVIGYWQAGAYHIDPATVDGYAAGPEGMVAAADATPIQALQVAPSTYVPGDTVTIASSLAYTNQLLAVLWRPMIPPGWSLIGVEANGGAPEIVGNEILFTGKLPPSPLELRVTYRVPPEASGDALVQADIAVLRSGAMQPETLLSQRAPAMLQRDSDGDGLPDWVETGSGDFRDGADTGTGADNPDSDGDGVLDGLEVRAGTSPVDADSVFRIRGLEPVESDIVLGTQSLDAPFVLRWSSVSGKTYRVLRSTNLIQGSSVMRSNVVATPPENVWIDRGGTPAAFFSIEVEE